MRAASGHVAFVPLTRYSTNVVNRVSGLTMNHRTWSPNLGIRFSSTSETKPLYPVLNVSKYIDNTTIDSDDAAIGRGGNKSRGADPIPESKSAPPIMDAAPIQNGTTDTLPVADGQPEARQDAAIAKWPVPPTSSLSYQISSDLFNKAREAKRGSPGSYWSYTMYQRTKDDGTTANVKVHYCRSKLTMETTCERYFSGKSVLGFDMEWQPWSTKAGDARSNASLIQLASEDHIGLFHIALFPKDDFVAPTFRKIMEDPNVSKAGVNIRGDCTRLKNYLGVETRGVFELSHLYKVVKCSRDKNPPRLNKIVVSLSTQVEEVLGLPLFKGDSVRSSNWTFVLNERQIRYSASDAYAAVQLYQVMEDQRLLLKPTPPRPHHAELNLPLRLADAEPEEVQLQNAETLSADELAVQNAEFAIVDDLEVEEQSMAHGPVPDRAAPASGSTAKLPPTPNKRPPRVSRTIDPRVQAADLRLSRYRSSKRSAVQVGPSFLRAYYIWYDNEGLNPEAVAQILRDPPLKLNTVTEYILRAVIAEGLPYSTERMRKEIISTLHPNVVQTGRYRSIVDACQKTTPGQ